MSVTSLVLSLTVVIKCQQWHNIDEEADTIQSRDAGEKPRLSYVYQSVCKLTYGCLIRLLGE